MGRIISPYFSLTTLGLLFWGVLSLKLVSLVFVLATHLSHDNDANSPLSLELGTRAIIHLSTGEMEGNVRMTRQMNNSSITGADISTTKDKKDTLPPAPLFALTEQSTKGLLPITGHDGTLPWQYYGRPFTPQDKRPIVAVILTNVGLSSTLTQEVLTLPSDITVSISPYAGDAKTWAKRLRDQGFESLVDLPMESDDEQDTDGDHYSLLTNVNTNENSSRLHWVLSRFPGFVGTLAPLHERLTSNAVLIRPIIAELSTRGILFLYLKNPNNTAVAELAKTQGFKVLAVDKTLDDDISPVAIREQLKQLADLAKTQGYAIGLAHSYPPTLDALKEWPSILATENVDLAPVSAIARKVYP